MIEHCCMSLIFIYFIQVFRLHYYHYCFHFVTSHGHFTFYFISFSYLFMILSYFLSLRSLLSNLVFSSNLYVSCVIKYIRAFPLYASANHCKYLYLYLFFFHFISFDFFRNVQTALYSDNANLFFAYYFSCNFAFSLLLSFIRECWSLTVILSHYLLWWVFFFVFLFFLSFHFVYLAIA